MMGLQGAMRISKQNAAIEKRQNKIQDLENQLTKSIQNLEDKIAIVTAGIFETVEAATINALKDYRWYKHPTTSMLTSMPASPSRGYYYQNTKISATPGSTYRITVYVMNAEQDTENIIAVASGSGTDSSYSDFLGLDVTLEEGMHDYYVTIPQGYNLLLVMYRYWSSRWSDCFFFWRLGSGIDDADHFYGDRLHLRSDRCRGIP